MNLLLSGLLKVDGILGIALGAVRACSLFRSGFWVVSRERLLAASRNLLMGAVGIWGAGVAGCTRVAATWLAWFLGT